MTLYAFYAGGSFQQISQTSETRARHSAKAGNGGIPLEIWYGKIPTSAAPIVEKFSRIGFKPGDRQHLLKAIAEFS